MFQYATARGLAGKDRVFLDLSLLKSSQESTPIFTARPFELSIFKNLKAKELSRLNQRILFDKRCKTIRKFIYPSYAEICQVENEFFSPFTSQRPIRLDGYFQSEKYFLSHRNDLIREFEFPKLIGNRLAVLSQIAAAPSSVALHIRRGDYLKQTVLNYHGLLPELYYRNSLEFLASHISNPSFFVFSDDPEWCEQNMGYLKGEVIFVGSSTVDSNWQDMYLMSQCQHHIIANSSFSWWGAWLSTAKGIKLAPAQWFNPNVANFQIKDFIPERWLIVDYD